MHSAITPLKVNRFGWNLEQSEYILGGWPWQIVGATRTVATASEPGESFSEVSNARFLQFYIGQILWRLHTTRRLVLRCKHFEQNFGNLTVRRHFYQKQNSKIWKIFDVLRLQASITLHWLLIDGNSLSNDPSTGCLVFIFCHWNQFKVIPLACTLRTWNKLPKCLDMPDAAQYNAVTWH